MSGTISASLKEISFMRIIRVNLFHWSTLAVLIFPSHHASGWSGSSQLPLQKTTQHMNSTSDWVFSPCLEDFHGVIHAGKGIVKETWPPFLRQLREDLWRGNVDLCFHCVPHNCLVKGGQVRLTRCLLSICFRLRTIYIYIYHYPSRWLLESGKNWSSNICVSTSSSSYVLGDDHHLSTCQGGGTPISRFSTSQALCQEALRGTCKQLECQLSQ